MKAPLKQVINGYFGQQRLSPRQLWRLRGAMQKTSWSYGFIKMRQQLLFVTVALVSIAVLYGAVENLYLTDFRVHQKIADEVAHNHLKLRPLDVQTDQFSQLRQFFSQLNFSPLEPHLWQSGMTLLGGRYCSIQGKDAAQLRFATSNGQLRTLYEAPYDEKLHRRLPDLGQGEPPLEMSARGLKVHLWHEQGLIFTAVFE